MSQARRSKYDIAKDLLGPLSLTEQLLLFWSKHPDDVDKTSNYELATDQWTVGSALDPFHEAFPKFEDAIRGKAVLDYGCGDGFQSVAMSQLGAAKVLGVEIEQNRRDHAAKLAAEMRASNVSFAEKISGAFDVIVSLNAMEHFVRPEENINEMAAALSPRGKIYLTFGPLWKAPYGHHMHFFTSAPWINLLFPEKSVFRIRRLYRDDNATSYEPDLNGMTIARFHDLVDRAGLKVETIRYRASGNLPLISKIPLLREYLTNIIDAVLVKA
ncbi:MAG: hypothetical protein DHS20C05_21200 [Hyphococcus sp.]|nr:MAG: hypothetical protein DHS20C05_21200 [Marinicaulis sp.]